MFDVRSFEAKSQFESDYQLMKMFESVRCSKIDVRVCSMFNKMVFDPSLIELEFVYTGKEIINAPRVIQMNNCMAFDKIILQPKPW